MLHIDMDRYWLGIYYEIILFYGLLVVSFIYLEFKNLIKGKCIAPLSCQIYITSTFLKFSLYC